MNQAREVTWNEPCSLTGFFSIMQYDKVNICMPVAGASLQEVLTDAAAAQESACALAEWRADYYEGKNYIEILRKIREVYTKPLIFTCRGLRDLETYKTAAASGCADYIDIDINDFESIGGFKCKGTELILSEHLSAMPQDTEKELARLAACGGSIVKMAVFVNNEAECENFMQAVANFKSENPDIPLIAVAMGEAGRKSRTAGYYGSFVTYCRGRVSTAEGQPSIDELLTVPAMITANGLKYVYKRTDEKNLTALDGISFSIERGSFTAIIGKNGSGKSTLAKCLNCLLLPGEGAVYVNGMDTKDEKLVWEIRKNCGMIFQNPDNQLVSSIVEDDVAFGPENLGMPTPQIEKAVESALKAVGMYEYRESSPGMLSGGQKQRIAIAGAIAMKPKCIVFDEPTAMLDPRGRADIMGIIRELQSEGITVILITHFMEEAAQAERIMVVSNGKVMLDGAPAEVFAHAEEIKSMDLALPFAVEIANGLRKKGIDVPKDVVDEEALIEFIVNG